VVLGKVILGALGVAAVYEVVCFIAETKEKHDYFNLARDYCRSVNKPLLRIGMQRAPWEPPNGDVTLDIDPIVKYIPGGVWGDERNMPFNDKQFGICFNEHTLEHLQSAEDVELAVNECVRVADKAIFLVPSPYRISTTLFEPGHLLRLWLDPQTNTIKVTQNDYRTGFGGDQGADVSHPPQVVSLQILVTDIAPRIIKAGAGYILS
jgi:hypothetical protein